MVADTLISNVTIIMLVLRIPAILPPDVLILPYAVTIITTVLRTGAIIATDANTKISIVMIIMLVQLTLVKLILDA